MGLVQRQVLKNNLIAFVGVGVGALSNVWVYPLDPAARGYIDGVLSVALLLVPLLLLGTETVTLRYFSYLEGPDDRSRAGQLLTRSLVVVSLAVLVLAATNLLFGGALNDLFARGALRTSRWQIIGCTAALAYAGVLTAHLINFRRIAVPVFFNNLLIKLLVPAIFVYAIYYGAQVTDLGWLLVGVYVLAGVGLLAYAISLGTVKLLWGRLKLPDRQRKQIYSLALFSIFSTIGSRLSVHIDTVSINVLLGDFDTGIYTLAKFTVGVILLPSAAVNSITAPIVADAWRRNDLASLEVLYRQSSTVLYAFGGVILVGTLVCLPYLYELTPSLGRYRAGYLAVLLLGTAQLVDLLTGINGNLIAMTDYFRWNVAFILFLGLVNAVMNYVFIAGFGMGFTGAAVATAISLIVYNLVKLGFVWWKLGLHPFSMSTLYTTGVIVGVGAAAYLLPELRAPTLNILLKGGVVLVLFLLYFRFTHGVPPVRRLLSQGLQAAFTG